MRGNTEGGEGANRAGLLEEDGSRQRELQVQRPGGRRGELRESDRGKNVSFVRGALRAIARTSVFTLRAEAVGAFEQRRGNKSIPAGLFVNQMFVK